MRSVVLLVVLGFAVNAYGAENCNPDVLCPERPIPQVPQVLTTDPNIPHKPDGYFLPQPELPPSAFTLTAVENQLIVAINIQRARYGLPALEVDTRAHVFARNHAAWMAHHGMRHSSGPYAENIAMGQQSVESVVSCWMNSRGHRANILNPNHRSIGVAVAYGANGQPYWCQDFSSHGARGVVITQRPPLTDEVGVPPSEEPTPHRRHLFRWRHRDE